MADRFMRIMVFFDLPVKSKKARHDYTCFRRQLIKDGFMMLQYSVYARLTRNHDDALKHFKYVEQNLPPAGSVRAMIVTEKQYAQMRIMVGAQMRDEKFLDSKDLLEL